MSVDNDAARAKVHEALGGYLEDGEIAVGWVLTIEVIGADDRNMLLHRAGGGMDGSQHPTAWTALGMLTASGDIARRQILDTTGDGGED